LNYQSINSMQAKSIKGRSPEAIQSALEHAVSDTFTPTLAIVFLSIKQDREAICNVLSRYNVAIFGATTNGEFIDEEYEIGTAAILLLDTNPQFFFIQFAELNDGADRQTSSGLAKNALTRFKNPAFLTTGSSLETDIEEMVWGFTDVLGHEATIAGGMAGDDTTFTKQYVFTNGKSSDRGIVCLVFDQDKIIMKARAVHGWKAVGTEKTVTKSSGNRVFTIDNIPALDLCLKYSGLPIDHPNLPLELVTNFPLQLQGEKHNAVMRPAYDIVWEDHSLLTSGKFPEGSKVRFSLPPDFDVVEKVVEENKNMRETEMAEADALLIYNCGGRLLSLGPLIGEEIKGMNEVWKAPMVGMFSHAEIGPTLNGHVRMHNLTTCWVVLKERE
jgi:hypothetical protein